MSSTISDHTGSSSGVPADRTGAGPGGAEPAEEERAAAAAVLRMIWGMHVSRAIYAVTGLSSSDDAAPLHATQGRRVGVVKRRHEKVFSMTQTSWFSIAT